QHPAGVHRILHAAPAGRLEPRRAAPLAGAQLSSGVRTDALDPALCTILEFPADGYAVLGDHLARVPYGPLELRDRSLFLARCTPRLAREDARGPAGRRGARHREAGALPQA